MIACGTGACLYGLYALVALMAGVIGKTVFWFTGGKECEDDCTH